MLHRTLTAALMACLIGMVPCLVAAGRFADDMAKCLVKSTSEGDKAELMRWMFSSMSLHPDLASMSKIVYHVVPGEPLGRHR
jgi:hypothetical protein